MENLYPFDSLGPREGLEASMAVLETVSCLISSTEDLHLLSRQSGHDSVTGLSYILDAVRKNLEVSAEELENYVPMDEDMVLEREIRKATDHAIRLAEAEQEATNVDGDLADTMPPEEAAADSYPKLSVREHAIIATYRQGHPVEEIAKAVNLKKQTVQRMIDQLRDNGAIPGTDDGEQSSLSASA